MANLRSVTDCIQYMMFRAGEDHTDSTGDFYQKALEYLNLTRLDLFKGSSPLKSDAHVAFKWAIKEPAGIFIIQPIYQTGTVQVTDGSSSITFSVAPTISLTDYYLSIDNVEDVFRISSHTVGNVMATIDVEYTGTSSSSATFKAMPLIYTLGNNDIIRLISPIRIYRSAVDNNDQKIYGIVEDKFDLLFPMNRIKQGVSEAFKILSQVDNNTKIQVSKYSTEKIKCEYRYILMPGDLSTSSSDSEIKIPREYRQGWCEWALALLQEDKTDNRQQGSLDKAQQWFNTMVKDYLYSDQEIDPLFNHIISREDDYAFGEDRVLRTSSGLIIG